MRALLLAFAAAAPVLAKPLPSPLDYADAPFKAELKEVDEKPGYREFELRFPSPVKSPFPVNDTVWGHLSVPKGKGPFPAILVLPVMATVGLGRQGPG